MRIVERGNLNHLTTSLEFFSREFHKNFCTSDHFEVWNSPSSFNDDEFTSFYDIVKWQNARTQPKSSQMIKMSKLLREFEFLSNLCVSPLFLQNLYISGSLEKPRKPTRRRVVWVEFNPMEMR